MKNSAWIACLALALPSTLAACSDSGGAPAATDAGSKVDSASDTTTTTLPTTDGGADATSASDAATVSEASPTDSGAASETSDAAFTPSAAAKYFCDGYKALCTFGATGAYADYVSCERAYDGYSKDSELCVANELGKSNCPGAACTGAPCSPCK